MLMDIFQLKLYQCVTALWQRASDGAVHRLMPIWQLLVKRGFGPGLPEWLPGNPCVNENVPTSGEFSVSGFPAA
jgi:hypothetical protein